MKTMDISVPIARCRGFQWDETNLPSVGLLKGVSPAECEQVFFNCPLFVEGEERDPDARMLFSVLGRTDAGRLLGIAFELSGELIRVISAHDMSGRERKAYAK
ncbi:MAG: BrnT family toxin [Candidatus Krumholzibacteriaceae bacterium]